MIESHRRTNRLVAVALGALLAVALAACGSDDKDSSAREGGDKKHSSAPGGGDKKHSSAPGGGAKDVRTVEKAFLTGMVHHHESAIDMAAIAKQRGKDRFIVKLAGEIASTQEREIAQMKAIYKRLLGGELKPDPRAHDGLGLSADEAGMSHDESTNDKLRAARPFDRAFVDEMVPHHMGAVTMSKVVLRHTKDGELRKLAKAIIATQEREIQEMNAFRTKKYAGPAPKGGEHIETTH
jgi:uncharacterized protein (DUF305 family)